MATVTRVDNVDPRIIYSGTWVTFPNNDAYNNTISLARDIGTTATLNFLGNSVAAFGQLGPNPPNAPATTRYQVDDGDPTTFAPASPSTDLHQLLFYQSPTLPYGSHKLVMTNVMDLDWIWFDYFEVTTS
ncbi:hypothetical protein BJ165DRAFT_1340251 [Panaeolus papilionaceus]|nr:hypothetical protein BJ165DRAFT_1340251 [Panaeolus papilionaceus]